MQILIFFFITNIKCIFIILILVCSLVFGIIYYQIKVEKISYFSNTAQRVSFVNFISQNDIVKTRNTYAFLMLQDIQLIGETDDLSNLQDIDKFIVCNSWNENTKQYLLDIYNNPAYMQYRDKYPNYLKSLKNIDRFCTSKF